MKKNIIIAVLLFIAAGLFAQDGNVKRKIITEPFTGLKVSGASYVMLMKGDDYLVVIDAPARIQNKISANVNGNTLVISYKNIQLKSHEDMKFYITVPSLSKIDVSGAADIRTSGDILTGDHLSIIASGASDLRLNLDYKMISANVSGATTAHLTGKVNKQIVNASGAVDYIAKDLVSDTAKIMASGASTVYVNVIHKINYKTTGAADVKFKGSPEEWNLDYTKNGDRVVISSPDSEVYISSPDYYNDTTKVKVGSIDIEVVDGDTVTVRIGGHQLRVDDDGNIKWERVRAPRFNGHWGGVELGINGYVTPQINTSWDSKYDYLNLKYERSVAVNLNIWEQNIAFNKAKTIGMMTGLGMAWNNYFFSNDTKLVNGESKLEGYYINGASVRKTKLTNMYITVPVLFEFQTNNMNRNKRFHFTIGGVIGARVTSHTKIYFNEANKEYRLEDPETGMPSWEKYTTPDRDNRNIVKSYSSFYQPPFRFDGRVSVGYGWLNIFATYGINGMFQKDRGPDLHPWTIGITLLGW
jgi:hypothetical protein